MSQRVARRSGSVDRWACATVLSLLVAVGMTSCQNSKRVQRGTPATPHGGASGSSSAVPGATAYLPVDQYMLTSSQTNEISFARELLAYRCAAGIGVALPAKPAEAQFAAADAPRVLEDRRYGIADMSLARQSGYHIPQRRLTGTTKPPKDAFADLKGIDKTIVFGKDRATVVKLPNGRSADLPAGGCLEVAVLQLTDGHDSYFEQSPTAEQINFASYKASLTDPAVEAVFRRWSRCMTGRGYEYSSPVRAIDDKKWATAVPTRAEIATATADVACKQSVGLIATWHAAEVRIQQRLIRSKTRQLAAERRVLKTQVSVANRIVHE